MLDAIAAVRCGQNTRLGTASTSSWVRLWHPLNVLMASLELAGFFSAGAYFREFNFFASAGN